jgi:F-type H+-transporting ATPase subunit epsilon
MSNKIHFKLITHEKIVYENDIDELYCQGEEGSFGILPNHTPFMTPLAIGVTKIVVDGKNEYFTTIGGVFQIVANNAVILTEESENGKDIDFAVAKAEKEKLEAKYGKEDNQKDNKNLAIALAKFKASMDK